MAAGMDTMAEAIDSFCGDVLSWCETYQGHLSLQLFKERPGDVMYKISQMDCLDGRTTNARSCRHAI